MKLKPSSWNVMCLTRGTSLSWHLSRHEYVHVIGTTGWDVIDSKWMNVLLFSNVAPGSLWNPWRSRNRSKTTTKWLHGVNEPADRIFVIVTSAKMWCTKWSHGRAIKSIFIVCWLYTRGYTFIFEEQNRINESTIGIRNDYYTIIMIYHVIKHNTLF